MIRDLHCWIGTYEDGTEGLLAGGLPGMGMSPLFSSRRHVAESMESIARQVMRMSHQTKHPVVSVRLVTFTSTEGTRS
jgi:hypothetical protein